MKLMALRSLDAVAWPHHLIHSMALDDPFLSMVPLRDGDLRHREHDRTFVVIGETAMISRVAILRERHYSEIHAVTKLVDQTNDGCRICAYCQ